MEETDDGATAPTWSTTDIAVERVEADVDRHPHGRTKRLGPDQAGPLCGTDSSSATSAAAIVIAAQSSEAAIITALTTSDGAGIAVAQHLVDFLLLQPPKPDQAWKPSDVAAPGEGTRGGPAARPQGNAPRLPATEGAAGRRRC